MSEDQPSETTPLQWKSTEEYNAEEDWEEDDENEFMIDTFRNNPSHISEMRQADRLSIRLLAVQDDDDEATDRILRESLAMHPSREQESLLWLKSGRSSASAASLRSLGGTRPVSPRRRFLLLALTTIAAVVLLCLALFYVSVELVGPPSLPVGPYKLVEAQEGANFFDNYAFYDGPDSVGSNGFNYYVSETRAMELQIINTTLEVPDVDVYSGRRRRRLGDASVPAEPFVYLHSRHNLASNIRDSVRLEGTIRYNRGLFILDVRHMPSGCGVWPAFWLTDEPNWPVNGEIDIVEGVNYQTTAKTALHSTKGCEMDDISVGTMTGIWDMAQGVPDAKTGKPDMTLRYATNCFVYDPHQWLNQGCVAVSKDNRTIGQPVNEQGGGVYALEWDPANRHIRTWVFSPHTEVPKNLKRAIQTADAIERVAPDPDAWGLPYGYFAVGDGTNCPASHFRHMRLVLNTAFCGSVAGNRFHSDCPVQSTDFDTCNEYLASDPEELKDAYWKIRGVYVYERTWVRKWMN